MTDRWEELLTVLRKMLSIYRTILALSQQKHDILVAAKSHELDQVTKQEEILILQVGKLEDLRGKIVSEIMADHDVTNNQGSLVQLQTIAPPVVAAQLENFGKELGQIITEMAPINKLNTELIKQALLFINYNINILSHTVVGPTYAAKGQESGQAPKRTVFDARV